MNEDCLKLTTYFGERDRVGHDLLADVLLDLYGRREVQGSILLRGAQGFGRKHSLRSDRLLTLSEDLPVLAIAVDSRRRIEQLLPEVIQIKRRGLLTLERARMLTGELALQQIPEERDTATKLTLYLGRGERVDRVPAFIAVCELLHRRGVAGATVLLGVDGTRHGQRQRARFFAQNAAVAMMIIAIGSGAAIGRALPELNALLANPLLTLERVRICKRDGRLIAAPQEPPAVDERGRAMWQKLTIVTSAAARHQGRPLHLELVDRLRRSRASGATSLRGIWGFHGSHAPHGDKLLALRRHVPMLTVVIDTPQGIGRVFPIVDELTGEGGLVTSEMVPALMAITAAERHGGLQLARRPPG